MQNRDPPRSDANSVPVYLLFVNILLKHLHDAGLPMRKRMMQKTAVGCSAASSAAAPIKWRRRPGLQHRSVAINWPNTNHLARARCEHWNVFSSPPLHLVLTSRCPDARRAKGHCCYRSSRVFSLDTLNWREKKLEIQQLAATRLCVPTFTVRGYLDFNTVTVIFYWDENIMFLRTAMTPDLWVTPCWVVSSAHLHGNTSST